MKIISSVIDFILHIDVHLSFLLTEYWSWLYGIVFLIIFVETWLVIMPFLPWDSLLFVAWSLAGAWHLNIVLLLLIVFVAAVIWDTVNYHIWKYFGNKMLKMKIFWRQLVKQEYVDRTQKFFDKHWKRTIILARFVPIVRTIAPFVAWIWNMKYRTFISYNIIWWFLWVFWLTLTWYFFGQIPFIKNNFEKVVLLIIFVSFIPVFYEYFKHKILKYKEKK